MPKHESVSMGAFDKGFRLDEETGQPTLEYSDYMRRAQDLTNEILAIRRELDALSRQPVPGREGVDPGTLDEMAEAERDLEELVKDWSTRPTEKDTYNRRLEKIRNEMAEAARRMGIPELKQRLEAATRQVQFLIAHERMIDAALRNMPPEGFADRNV